MSEALMWRTATGPGELWGEAQRRALREQLRAGTLSELEFDAVVYRTGPNANFVRFREHELAGFAASFCGKPFLRNHTVEDIGARDGLILDSRLVGDAFVQRIRLTTARGLRDFLDGIIDRFSISWDYDGIECSLCGEDWFGCPHWPGRGQGCELVFLGPVGKETSAVNAPAVAGTGLLARLCQVKLAHSQEGGNRMGKGVILLPDGREHPVNAHPAEVGFALDGARGAAQMTGAQAVKAAGEAVEKAAASAAALLAEARALAVQMEQRRVEELIEGSGLSAAGKEAVWLACAGKDASFAREMIEAQRKADAAVAERQVVRGIRPITESMMQTPQDRVQSALNWLFGARDEPAPPPSMRSIRDLYQAITGDHNWYGVFNPEWAQLAAASTTTLAGMVVNALNKVVRMHYDSLATYRWYETIVDVVPHDGSTHAIELIMVDGLANLPTVGEGAAYTEATVGDSKESMAFTKRGHYVGITLETIRRSNIQRIQAIPREMVKASIRTRSAAIAGIFTANGGVGPTLADDSTALFHANHGNLDTTAFSAAAWGAARQRIWSQTTPGTGSPLGLWPTFCLVPIDLYDTALEVFGYGSGDVGKPNTAGTAQTPNPYGESRVGDPRPIPIAVPEWTDANDWAYIVDPRLHPVIHMAYANAPQGGTHPMPEIFEVTSETSGLIFTNDTLPVKIRDWWGYGVSAYVGIGKNNVA
ncbi:MAG TPA: hypothetical protein VNK95_06055 [Caldilineaceae bacterium]|nr:hypothetical protein [Caldilineaceae bacterium]